MVVDECDIHRFDTDIPLKVGMKVGMKVNVIRHFHAYA